MFLPLQPSESRGHREGISSFHSNLPVGPWTGFRPGDFDLPDVDPDKLSWLVSAPDETRIYIRDRVDSYLNKGTDDPEVQQIAEGLGVSVWNLLRLISKTIKPSSMPRL